MEPGAVFYLQVSGGAGQALRTPGGLVGTSSVHSAKSYRACLEVAYGTAGPRGGGSSYPVLGHIHLMPCSNCPSWVCCPHRHHSHSHWDYWMHITWRGRECSWPCPIQSSSCTEVSKPEPGLLRPHRWVSQHTGWASTLGHVARMGPVSGCDTALALLGPAEHACCPQGKATGWGLNLLSGAPVGLMASLSPEHLLKLPLEDCMSFSSSISWP